MFFGLEWLKYGNSTQSENLYYWHRESANGNAEIDYVVQKGEKIMPIEVKASTKGSMQSMFRFLEEKKIPRGIRVSFENFSGYESIEVFPIYAISTLKEMG